MIPENVFPFWMCLGMASLALTSRLAAGEGLVLVTNKGDQTLSIDPATELQIATGHELAASLDGARAFVPVYGNSGVGKPGTGGQLLQVIDLKEWKVKTLIEVGKNADGLAWAQTR